MSQITVSAFKWVPPFAQGLVRDLRVRWALEEAGWDYEMKLIGFEDQQTDAYLALQPFGQVPSYTEDGLTLFETGSIVLHIAERSEALMPADEDTRALVRTWIFAALNSVEPPIMMLIWIDKDNPACEHLITWIRKRLGQLAEQLEGKNYLVGGSFTAADLLMASVLLILRSTDLLQEFPTLVAYRDRCTSRPAFQKSLKDQLDTFAAHEPPPKP